MRSSNSIVFPEVRQPAFAGMPIKQKLMVITMSVTTAALLISGIGVVVLDSILFRGYLQKDLAGLAQMTANNSTAALSFDDPIAAAETLATLRVRTNIVAACIYRTNGAIFARYARSGDNAWCPPASAADRVRITGRDITVSHPIMLSNRRIGTLVLLHDLNQLSDRMRIYGASVLAILLASSLIAYALSTGLRRLIANPISLLALTTAAVSETKDYGIRAQKITRDELGVLVDAFNQMLDGIQSRDEELRSAREQLQLVTDTMAAAVVHCSRDFRFVWVNRRYAEMLQTTPDAIVGRAIPDVMGKDAFATIRPFVDQALAGQRVEYEAEVNYSRIGLRWVRAAYVPTCDASGFVDGWVADISDITALKNAQAEVARINADLQKTNQQLARSNEDLEGFAFAASHDLQEPLRMITTYVQLLLRSLPGQLDDEADLFVRNIVDGATRMRTLLADLLAYSEIGGDHDEPIDRVDLNAVVDTVRQNLKVAVEETGAVITSDKLPMVAGYTGHFVQLFQNLVGNAIKYRGEAPPRVHISFQRLGNQLKFGVTDNGIGIAPAYHGRIFGVFKRLHGKKIPGTGIGLAICQRVVERARGRIWVESQLGHGATFFFTLPENAGDSDGGSIARRN